MAVGARAAAAGDGGGAGDRERPDDDAKPALVKRLEARREQYQHANPVFKVVWVIAGFVVVIAGLAMLALPGPAFVVIPVGLAMLSLQFAWAGRLLEKALVKAAEARRKAQQATPRQKAISAGLTAVAVVAFVVLWLLYDIPIIPG